MRGSPRSLPLAESNGPPETVVYNGKGNRTMGTRGGPCWSVLWGAPHKGQGFWQVEPRVLCTSLGLCTCYPHTGVQVALSVREREGGRRGKEGQTYNVGKWYPDTVQDRLIQTPGCGSLVSDETHLVILTASKQSEIKSRVHHMW